MKNKNIFFILIILVIFVNGCARTPKRPEHLGMSVPATMTSGGMYYTIPRGETLYHLAKVHNISVSELMRVNHISDPSQLEVGQRIFIPTAGGVMMSGRYDAGTVSQIRNIVGPKRLSSDWRTITVHHSGTRQGSARAFDKDHQRRHMGGLFYHFVIGNGTQTRNGQIEVGWRWRSQVKANRPYDIQICLVGNFDDQQVSEQQFNTLVILINTLREQYNIPIQNVRQHRDIRGKHTDCPGKRFPFSRLLSALSAR